MSDKMMRIAGRGADGLAKAITVVQDTNGDWVLRMVDAAPFAYDEATDTKKIMPKKALPEIQTLSETVNIAPSGNRTFTIQPPIGELWHIKHLSIDIPVPTGATSGSTILDALYSSISSNLNQIFTISNAFGAKVVIRGSYPLTKNNNYPISDTDFARSIQNIVCSNENPLLLLYTNLTNATQTGTIGLKIVKEIEYIS